MLLKEFLPDPKKNQPAESELKTTPEELKKIGEIVGVRTGAPKVEDEFV
jgi:hypothetical protein